MRYRLTLPLSLLVLTGCATGPSLQSRMAAYVGAPEDTVVQSLGVPNQKIDVNGVQYLTYEKRREQPVPEPQAFGGPFGPDVGPWGYGAVFATDYPQYVAVWSCDTTFVVSHGRVASFTLKGNACA
jgi:hypothetical protein